MKTFISQPLELPGELDPESRADLLFYGVDHSGPSYICHVFLDNPDAGTKTPLEPESGYLGTFTVFGHGGCFGDEGHCEPERPTTDAFDLRGPHPLKPFVRTIEVTDELRRAIQTKAVISAVPTVADAEGLADPDTAPASHVRLAIYEG